MKTNYDFIEKTIKSIQNSIFEIEIEISGRNVDIGELIQELEDIDRHVDDMKTQQDLLRAVLAKLTPVDKFDSLPSLNGKEMSEQEKNEIFRTR